MPFVLNLPRFHSRMIIDRYLIEHDLKLEKILELSQTDMHYMLAARDFAAAVCWSMFVPMIQDLNSNPVNSHLNVYPIKGIATKNAFVMISSRGKIFPAYAKDLIQLVRDLCSTSAKTALPD